MEEVCLLIPLSKWQYVESKRCRLLELFGVDISVDQGSFQDSCGSDSAVRILLTHSLFNKYGNNAIHKAKAYIQSLIGVCEDYCTCIESYDHEVYRHLQTHHNDIERESQAVVHFNLDGRTIQISGQSFNVAIAKSVMERLRYSLVDCGGDRISVGHKLLVATGSGNGGNNNVATSIGQVGEEHSHHQCANQHNTVIHTLSPGGESSHDSCYDSDCSPTSSRRNSSHRLEADLHTDISRTTSDTLGEELAEDHGKIGGDHVTSEKSEVGGGGGGGKGYTSKVEFALKLGYTESQIGSVLDKLGANVDQNELLGELIKLGSSHEAPISLDKKSHWSSVVDSSSFHSSDLYSDKSSAVHAPLEKKSSGSNRDDQLTNLRPIVIDGSNVAMSHGNKEVFSCQGIKLAVDFFKQRGHTEVTVFVPQWRKEASRNDNPITDQEVLYDLEREKILVFTPARRVGGKRVICYDDRYIVKLAAENGGIVVSNDNYRDLLNESPEFKEVIEQRLLMYSFVNDRFMPPDDPLGRHGPLLDQFLQKEPILQEPLPPVCPYGKKCTYGNKCKYYHPERGSAPHRSVTDRLKEEATLRLKQAKEKGLLTSTNSIGDTRSVGGQAKKPLGKTKSLVQATQSKRALTRTKSLVPGVSSLSTDSGHQKQDPDKLDIHRSNSPASSRSLSPSLTVTPAPSEGKSDQGRKSNHASPRRSPSPRDLSATAPGRLDSAVKIQPEHLSVVHEVLRPVLSDPTPEFHRRFHLHQYGGVNNRPVVETDDLAVGGKSHLVPGRGTASMEHGQYLTKAASASEVNETEGQAMHRRLQRQLSLKGAEDPRILRKAKPREHVPTFRFHGTAGPIGPLVHQQPQHQPQQVWPSQHLAMQYVDPFHLALYQNMQAQIDAELQKKQQHSLRGAGTSQNNDSEEVSSRMRELNNTASSTLMPPEELMKSHQPLGKMPSAPGAFIQSDTRTQTGAATPRMNRQNSTSDSSLHQSKDMASIMEGDYTYPGMFGDPRWAFQGSISGQRLREPFEQNTKQDLFSTQTPDRFFLLPDGSKHFQQTTEDLELRQGIKVEFGPCGERQGHIPPGRATPGAPVSGNIIHPGKTGDQSPVRGHQGLQKATSRNTVASSVPALMGSHNAQGLVGASQVSSRLVPSEKEPVPGHLSVEKSEQIIPIEDPRHQIYFHLCGLFDEKKVLQVMTAYPEETNPQVLCAYLIGIN